MRMQRNTGRQVLISTHSAALLSDPDIEREEVLLLKPVLDGSEAAVAGDARDALFLLEWDATGDQVAYERTHAENLDQLNLFE